MRTTILVTAAGGPAGINVIRALKKIKGVEVLGTDANPFSAGFAFCDKSFVVPYAKDKKYFPTMKKICNENKVDFLIPTYDEALKVFSSNNMATTKVVCSPKETIDICDRKDTTYKKLFDVVPCPKWVYLKDAEKLKLPVFVKPCVGRGSSNTIVVNTDAELRNAKRMYSEKHDISKDIIATEYLSGDEYTVDALFDFSGKLVVAVPRIRMQTESGISVKGRTIKDEKLEEYIKRISKKLTFFGPVNIQFKKDAYGEFKLVEINPRFSGGLEITELSGVDLVALLMKLLRNEKIEKNDTKWKETTVLRYYRGVVFDEKTTR